MRLDPREPIQEERPLVCWYCPSCGYGPVLPQTTYEKTYEDFPIPLDFTRRWTCVPCQLDPLRLEFEAGGGTP